ncbi:hypothetical protein IC762_23825 [Bradyrhizobium genosp. L]|uniref:hypothetical protein n=1 Tax=Bradyrhizobium genosp. L TaxID=83637 RepID=UPI0018A28102|nr:hypothetical protein [Bradyrhizobium genosp. L]QPF82758.1 hypothetical protein IC762_23825 [Bradyrhizobium genosp. L]
MLNPRDLNTYAKTAKLQIGGSGSSFGTSIITYEIRRYQDIRNLGNEFAYLLTCKHRVIIPNANNYQVGPTSSTGYSNYPAAIFNSVTLAANNGATLMLREIFPRTLNTSVTTSVNSNVGGNTTTSNQHTTGSSTSQTNSFGVAVSGGFFGDMLTGGITLENQNVWGSGKYSSDSSDAGSGRQFDASSGETMSVKDWSSYGFINETTGSANWIWGQSYPWDVILYNQSTNASTVNLPSFVQGRMKDNYDAQNYIVLPPSQLSLMGVDFTMRASWLIEFPSGISAAESITISHNTSCFLASHSLNGSAVSASLQTASAASKSTFVSPALPLSTYALDPIADAGPKNGAAIGFTANRFTFPPNANGGPFQIVSPSNNLKVSGAGFDPAMTSNFAQATSFTIEFKILDNTNEYSLLLMHWIGASSGACKLTVTTNGTSTTVVYVDSPEGQGGQSNVTAIELRNADFSSINYHDYLVIGLNTITITVEPVNPNQSNLYTLFALAIGNA